MTNYTILTTAESEYAALEEAAKVNEADALAANEAIEKNKAIGDVIYSEISKVKIDTARTEYNELTNDQKMLVTNYVNLIEAESEYAALKEMEEKEVLGDVTRDGKVDIIDALIISRFDAGLTELDETQERLGDINGDGETNIADALYISRLDAGLITETDQQ